MSESARGTRTGSVLTHAVLVLGAVAMIGPFVWQLLTAFKSLPETTTVPPTLLPEQWLWSNFADVFDVLPFGQQLVNSLIVAVAVTVGQLAFCSLGAYAFARLEFRGRELIFALFLSVLMVPKQLLILPQYQIMSDLGLLNTLTALVLPGLFSAFGTFLLRQFFATIPKDFEEAALLDGAGRFRIFFSIMLPLVKPALAALAVITVMHSWNDLLWPLVVNTAPATMPISAGLTSLQGQEWTDYPVLMAGSLMASIPMLLAYLALQRQFVQGIALSGTKGCTTWVAHPDHCASAWSAPAASRMPTCPPGSTWAPRWSCTRSTAPRSWSPATAAAASSTRSTRCSPRSTSWTSAPRPSPTPRSCSPPRPRAGTCCARSRSPSTPPLPSRW